MQGALHENLCISVPSRRINFSRRIRQTTFESLNPEGHGKIYVTRKEETELVSTHIREKGGLQGSAKVDKITERNRRDFSRFLRREKEKDRRGDLLEVVGDEGGGTVGAGGNG